MNTASSTISPTNPIADMAGRAHQAVDQAAGRAAPAIERAQNAAHRTIDTVAGKATPAADWAAENSRRLVTRSTEVVEACGSYVRERPVTSIAGALAVGYLIGRIVR